MFNTYKRIKDFDEVTRFRLINAFITAIGINLLTPVIMDMKGEYLVAWVISMFMIIDTLSVKTNRWVVDNFTLDEIYKLSAVTHLIFTTVALLYFITPVYMVYGAMVSSIIEVSVFSAYSIMLNNYLTEKYPESMSNFQIVRNSTWADGILIGLFVTTVITFFWGNPLAVLTFILFNTMFSLWLMYNWNFFKNLR